MRFIFVIVFHTKLKQCGLKSFLFSEIMTLVVQKIYYFLVAEEAVKIFISRKSGHISRMFAS